MFTNICYLKWYRHICLMRSFVRNLAWQNLPSISFQSGNRTSWRCRLIYFKKCMLVKKIVGFQPQEFLRWPGEKDSWLSNLIMFVVKMPLGGGFFFFFASFLIYLKTWYQWEYFFFVFGLTGREYWRVLLPMKLIVAFVKINSTVWGFWLRIWISWETYIFMEMI